MPELIRIAGFQGFQVDSTEPAYNKTNQQYATSTYGDEHHMHPSLIVQPLNEKDVVTAVKWARDNKVRVAVKSGGHQYSGASSTDGNNIQIDLTNTFKDFEVVTPTDPVPDDRALVLIGVSVTMVELNKHLQANKLFVPTGQCATVGVGGHGQTGGYGELGRSFGLFGDQIRVIHLIGHDGESQDVSKTSDPELFYAILGGSPGNFGIITHYVVEVFKADSYIGSVPGPGGYKGPHAIKAIILYTKDILVSVLGAVTSMAEDPTFPRGFDLCVSLYSKDLFTAKRFDLQKDADWERAREKVQEVYKDQPEYLKALGLYLPPVIIIYAQWCPTSKDDKYNTTVDKWFETFRQLRTSHPWLTLYFQEYDQDMSKMTGLWLMHQAREYDLPYVKRTYSTRSTTLTADNWAAIVAERVDLIYNSSHFHEGQTESEDFKLFNNCHLVVQIQCFGGNESMFHVNKDNGTSYSWRDSTVVQTMDCFHNDNAKAKKRAENWQTGNDEVMIGPKGVFSKQEDRRLLWGSWGDWNMANEKVWRCYYEDEEKYQRLGRARGRADPKDTFTPNVFAVQAIKY